MRPTFPAYGRELLRRRQNGDHPGETELLLVALGFWPRLADGAVEGTWERGRAVVVPDDARLARLELRMLAGTQPVVAFHTRNEPRARELVPLIHKVEPLGRIVFAVDIEARRVWWCFAWGTWWERSSDSEGRNYWPPIIDLINAAALPTAGHEDIAA